RKPKALQGRIFEKIFTIAKISAMDTQEYIAYQRSIKSYRDIKSGEISSYELGMEEGEKLGLEKGEKLGHEKGIESIVKKMHINGSSAETISTMTGIEVTKIKSILSK
ncbi:MAG: hypothetical protein JJU41_05060, partial [Bacteroidetes bacterium]|nr:hypothetical protein [Bacteroidota bacterium]